MLFRPNSDQNLDGVAAALESWSEEAYRFRSAALRARAGDAPSSLIVAAAEEAHDALMSLLDEMDRAFDGLKAGRPEFAALLKMQSTALGLLESIGNSHDVLISSVAAEVAEPRLIARPLLVAAE